MAKSVFRVVAAVATSIALTFSLGPFATAAQSAHFADVTAASAGDQLDMGIMTVTCSESSGRGNPGGVPYAYYARSTCTGEVASDVLYQARVRFKCSSESSYRYGPWVEIYLSRSSTSQGWCPYPKTVTSVATQTEYVGP